MNKELENRLQEKYYDILPANFYFEIREGWYGLVKNLLHVIDDYVARTPLDGQFQIVQIKEKWGGLRVYVDHGDDFIYGAIAVAECMSNSICEVCGAPGEKVVKSNWLRTRCWTHV